MAYPSAVFEDKFDYVFQLCTCEQMVEYNGDFDDQGNPIPDINSRYFDFVKGYPSLDLPFSIEDVMKDPYGQNGRSDIGNTLARMNLDCEKFWYAVAFIYYYTGCVSKDLSLGEDVGKRISKILDYCNGSGSEADLKVTFKKKGCKGLVDHDNMAVFAMTHLLAEYSDNGLTGIVMLKTPYTPSMSRRIWFVSNMFFLLLDVLGVKRKRGFIGDSTTPEYSLSKYLLVSRLVYVMGYTDNDAYIYSSNSLKGVLNSYKDSEFDAKHI